MSRHRQVTGVLVGSSALLVTIAVTAHVAGAGHRSTDKLVLRSASPGAGSVVTASPDPSGPGSAGGSGARGPSGGAVASLTPPQAAFDAWASTTAAATGVPARALVAYAAAQQRLAHDDPGCHLTWPTLAGIGYVESDNGGAGGGLLASGRPFEEILGVGLDGAGQVAAVADTDHGRLDHDPTLDRAVGPLQFLPSTWALWAADGDDNGVRDPQDVDDAALAAGRYLCTAGDLASADGWDRAVLSYNHSADYVNAVYDAAQTYAGRSVG